MAFAGQLVEHVAFRKGKTVFGAWIPFDTMVGAGVFESSFQLVNGFFGRPMVSLRAGEIDFTLDVPPL